ncbi:MAG TPA: type II secretion system F family protein [Candidatus Paceibacterota bacterium]
MLYKYEITTPTGERRSGNIEAVTEDIAVSSLQNRNLIVVSIKPAEEKRGSIFKASSLFDRVSSREIVVFSRQLSTLFQAKVSVIESFKLLASGAESNKLKKTLFEVVEDIQGGVSMSQAMAKHQKVFSDFYISMVRSGEESGKLDEIFAYLADYLERSYEIVSKARNALIYPAFVIFTFFSVLVLMLVFVIPNLGKILKDTGQELPVYTKIILGLSDFLLQFGVIILVIIIAGALLLWRYLRTKEGKALIAREQISLPYIGSLYQKFYIARVTDNLATLMSSGIPVVHSFEIAADVVGNLVYANILRKSVDAIKSGSSISEVFSKYKDVPPLVTQMIKVGEESGRLNFILATLSKFYRREVDNAVDTLVSLIEPVMIVALGLAVGILLVSVLGPIYNVSSGIQ